MITVCCTGCGARWTWTGDWSIDYTPEGAPSAVWCQACVTVPIGLVLTEAAADVLAVPAMT